MQGGLNQQVPVQGNLPVMQQQQQQQIIDQPNQIPLDRPQRSLDGLPPQPELGMPQQDIGVQGLQQQLNNQQQQNPGLQQQVIQQQPLDEQQIVQQKQLDQIPALGQNDLPNLRHIGVDANAANRQLKHAAESANTHIPKTKDKMLSPVSKDSQHHNEKIVNIISNEETRLKKQRTVDDDVDVEEDDDIEDVKQGKGLL